MKNKPIHLDPEKSRSMRLRRFSETAVVLTFVGFFIFVVVHDWEKGFMWLLWETVFAVIVLPPMCLLLLLMMRRHFDEDEIRS